MVEESLIESPSSNEQETADLKAGVFTITVPAGALRDVFRLCRPPWYLLNPFLNPFNTLLSIIDRILKIFEIQENVQQAIRIRRESISFTPTYHFPIREFSLSPILNN